jgi:predicted glycoside hydrolase/deacetylase ChbG (UPF0249 family)
MPVALIVNADDLGVSRGANAAIARAHRDGIVTSASMAVTYGSYEHALEAVESCPDLGVGLHFTLTSGTPRADRSRVPLLVNEDGFFRWRFSSLLAAAAGGGGADLRAQIRIELEAQLDRLAEDGVTPDHVNGERHVHLIPGIFEVVAAVARERSIPYVRMGRDAGWHYLRAGHCLGLLLRGGFVKSLLLSALSRRARRATDLQSCDHVVSYLYSGRTHEILADVVRGPVASGVVEIMVHPGLPEESRDLDLGNRELEGYLELEDRRRELEACLLARDLTPRLPLTTYRELAQAT